MDTIFDLCTPRRDVAEGRMLDEEFAADLGRVVRGTASPEYQDPAVFFAHTHPTRGLRSLLEVVCRRLSGTGGEVNSVIRLDTQYGGGKTHGLIALVHAARGMQDVPNAHEFIDPALLPTGNIRIAALDGENSDPSNGLRLEDGVLAHSMWGELAYRLAGRAGYERVRRSDETHTAPGESTIAELFGGEPTLILIDEISVYLRKVAQHFPDSANQFTAFIQALIKAVTSTPQVALVFTLAVRSDDKRAQDAYKAEHDRAIEAFAEVESVASRKATQLNPTEEDETIAVLRRRLFERIDDGRAAAVIDEYFHVWDRNRESLPSEAFSPETRDQFQAGYPLHPETLNVLIEKTSSLANFQRIRGMIRLLGRTVHRLWTRRPDHALAIHPHDIDPSFSPIREEILTRLEQRPFAPALAADIASVQGRDPATAQRIDAEVFVGQPPVTSYVARTIFLHTLAYGDAAKGVTPEQLRFSVCSPAIEPSFVDAALKRFKEDSLYLDDRPGVPLRFQVEPNLVQIINHFARNVDSDEIRDFLNARIKELFATRADGFELIAFPSGPYEVPDEVGNGQPYLVVLHHDAHSVSDAPTELPSEIVRMATRKGVNEDLRSLQNNLVFVVADERFRDDMKAAVRRRLGLEALKTSSKMKDLAEYQQRRVNEEYEKTSSTIALAILQCYRHLFYPSHMSLGRGDGYLSHTAIEIANASDKPGNGQTHIKRTLRDLKKILDAGDQPDAPTFVRDQTPLKTKGQITTAELRSEFRKAPKLSILLADDPLIACIRKGIEQKTFIYRKGEQVWGPGDPAPAVEISENAFVHTMENAQAHQLWPRRPKADEAPPTDGPGADGGGATTSGVGKDGSSPTPTGLGAGTRGDGTTPPPSPAMPSALSGEGPLRQALTILFEKARKQKVPAVARLTVRLFEPKGAWAVHQAAATYRDGNPACQFEADVSADGVESLQVAYRGTLAKANAVKQFLDSQIRMATEANLEAEYTLNFGTPLKTDDASAEEFIKAMTKYGGGEAYVEAQAAVPQGA